MDMETTDNPSADRRQEFYLARDTGDCSFSAAAGVYLLCKVI